MSWGANYDRNISSSQKSLGGVVLNLGWSFCKEQLIFKINRRYIMDGSLL